MMLPLQILHSVLGQRRRHRPQQEEREDKNDHTGRKGRPDQVIGIHREDHHRGDAEDDVFSDHRDQRDPDGSDEDPPVQPVRIRVPVRAAAAVEIAEGHRDHDRPDDDGPDDLRRGEVRRQQPAGSQLHRHDRHSGEKLRQVEIDPVLEDRSRHCRIRSQMRSTVSVGRSAYIGSVSTRSATCAATGVFAGSNPAFPA